LWSNSCDTLGVIAGLHAAVRSAFVIITSELQGKIPVSYYAKSSNSPPEHGMIEKMPYVGRGVSYLRTHRSTSLQGVFTTMFSEFGAVLLLYQGVSISLSKIVRYIEISMCVTDFLFFFLQPLGQSTLIFGEGKKVVELSPSG